MFFDAMSLEEKQALLGALGFLASVDGAFTSEEVSLIEVMATVLDVDSSTVLSGEPRTLREILTPLVDARHRRAVLIELVRMAYVDQRFSAEELVTIDEIAKIFEIDEATLTAVKEWVEQELACKHLAEDLIEKGG